MKLVNVYSNVQQKRVAARQMLNKKSSEERLPRGGILYNQGKLEQRYKSHVRGSEVPGMVRNQSKPTLELPSIHGNKADRSRNDMGSQILQSDRSEKSLALQSPQGYNISMPHVQVKRDLENRRASDNYRNEISKIYMIQGSGAMDINSGGMGYQKRLIPGHSPQANDLGGVNGLPLAGGGGYFHQRGQSLDVGSLSTGKKPLKNQIGQRKRAAMLSGNNNQQYDSAGDYEIAGSSDKNLR